MSDAPARVAEILRRDFPGRRLTIGVFYRGAPAIADALVADGHRGLLVGDRFGRLYRAYRRLAMKQRPAFLAVEARFEDLPIGPRLLDAFVISPSLPRGHPPVVTLTMLRKALKPGGLLLWPHQITNGFRGRLGCALVPGRWSTASATKRQQLCAWAMEAGFGEVSQVMLQGTVALRVLTTGRAGRRPWE